MAGHLFVLRGDLTQLSCDALLVPVSARPDVTSSWRDVLPAERLSPGPGSWLRVSVDLPEDWPQRRVVRVPQPSRGRDVWLVRTDGHGLPPAWIGQGLAEGVRAAAAAFESGTARRHKRLVALPLAGTGDGGFTHQRGAVVQALVPALERVAREVDVDVALVLRGEGDHVAVQTAREDPARGVLSEEQLEAADRLGGLAARRHLVLFLGAGVSMAAGLPSWKDLLAELAEEAGLSATALEHFSATDAAQILAQAVPQERFATFMRERFTMTSHSLAHALLAGLGAREVVTTNYDNGYELAATAVQPPDTPLRSLPRDEASEGSPWLLKLHGDASRPESIVLTRDQYLDYGDLRGPLGGMVQALLLTRHMLFVGFSLVDDNFARLAHQVRRLLALDGTDRRLGTVLFLGRDELRERLWEKELDHVAMTPTQDSDVKAARLLEVFLDRLAWRAQREVGGRERLLLDPDYEGMDWSDDEVRLRSRLRELLSQPTPEEQRGDVWKTLRAALRAYGATGI